MDRFRDRIEAGRQLGDLLSRRVWSRLVVLALPRGGVPVAAAIADRLGGTLDVFVARKVGAPSQPEFGIGAIAEGGTSVIDPLSARAVGVTDARFAELAEAERVELDRRVTRYRGDRLLAPVAACDVIVVDDGLATGVTAEAALRAVRALAPARLVLAVPVAADSAVERLRPLADDVVAVRCPHRFRSVGEWYRDFEQVSDAEVIAILGRR